MKEAVSSGHVFIDGVEVVGANEFSKSVATINKTLSLTPGAHTLEVRLASAPGSLIQLTLDGVIPLGDLIKARVSHTATLLSNGKVLVVGGTGPTGVQNSAELFDPVTLSATALTRTLTTARTEHTATLLPQTETLLIAGQDSLGQLFSTEMFNPSSQTFRALSPNVQVLRSGHTATLLLDGGVVITGGQSSGALGSAESINSQTVVVFKPAYDPEAGTFTVLPNGLVTPRWDHTATLLPNGQILITGGRNDSSVLASAELFDPVTETFTALASAMTTPRAGHTATLLPDGRVLILGSEDDGSALATAEVFHLSTTSFTAVTPGLTTPRGNHTAILLPTGLVMISGGQNSSGILASTELYMPTPADTMAPVVNQVTPPSGVTGVDLTEIIAVRFSEPVDVRTLTTASVMLTGSSLVSATLSPGEQGLMVFLVTSSPLTAGTTYTLSLTSDIKDTSGNPLTPFTSQFTTVAAPSITSFTPDSGTVGTAVTITGTNFDPDASKNEVRVNGALATVTAASATSLTAPVPGGATTGPITVTTRGGTATSAVPFTVIAAPTITGFTPTSGRVGDQVTIIGTNFVNVQSVKFNGVAVTSFTVNTVSSITVAVPSGATTGPLTVTTTLGTATSVTSFTVLNSPPVLTPIGNQTVALGTTLTLTVTATDPDNQNITFAITPLPLLAHAAFDVQTGVFTFTPDVSQVGTFTWTFTASDGSAASSEIITVTVTGAPPGGVTGVSGQVREPLGPPIPNIIVTLKGTTFSTRTDAEGRFTLTGLPSDRVGRQQLILDGFSEGDHALLVTPVDLTANVITQLPSAFSLPAVDKIHTVTVNPNAITMLSNPTIPGVTVTIAPGTAKNAEGTLYSGTLSISVVPEYGRPESRPAELRPGFSIAIQPAGVIMDPPAPIVFPNFDNMAPGAALDLWSLSPDTGLLYDVGKMQVSADGQSVVTVSGGVRKTAWHFVLAPPGVSTMAQNPLTSGPCTACQTGSQAELQEGALALDQVIPGVRSLGSSRDLALRYRSTSADMRPILPVDATLGAGISRPQTFSVRLTVGAVQQGTELYWDAAGLPPQTQASVSRLGFPFDAAALPTGRYPFDLMLFSNYSQSSIGGGLKGRLLLRNERGSAFGAGWTLQGLDRLYVQTDGAVLLASGDGENAVFGQQNRPLVVESLDLSRSGGVTSAGQYSFVAGPIYAGPRAALLDLANFGPVGVVERPVQLRTGLNTITTNALTGVDVFVLNHWSSTPPSSSEVVALEQFVNEGGVLIELQANFPSSARPIILGTFPGTILGDSTSVLTPEGLTSPLVQGPFGTVLTPITTGTTSDYPVLGAFTAVANNDRGPDILMLPQGQSFGGAGRAAFFADAEVFASDFPCCGSNLFNVNRALFLNTFAFAAGAPGFRPPAPLPGTGAIYVGPPGDFSTLAKNSDGTFTRTLKDGSKYQFNAQGLQTTVVDRNGNTTTYAYDGQGNLTTVTDPTGQVTMFAYSGARLASITDPAGRVTQFAHDSDGNLTRITYADTSEVRFDYDSQRRLTQRTDARGQVYQYAYDFAGRFTQATLPTGETRRLTPTQRAAVPDLAAGEGTKDNPAPLASPSPPASFQDGNGHTSSFTLDTLGRVTQQTDALNRVTTIERDTQGNPTKITRPNGAITTMTYDAKGNLLTTTEQAISATTTFTYEPVFNQVTSIKDPMNNTTTITYDAKGNPLTITDPANNMTTLTYDIRGLLTSTKDALNQITSFTYDALGRLLTTTDPLNRTTTLTYDAAGNVATSTDALNRVTSFQYDAKNRLTQVTDPAGGLTHYAYDGNGNLLTVTDAKDQVTTFTYDARNQLASTTDPLGRTETYTYDGADNLLTRVTHKGDTISFAYDAVNQLLSKTLPRSQVTSYVYDSVGNLTGVTDQDSELTMTYDLANRLMSVSTTGSPYQPAMTLSYTYDKNGNRLTLTDPTATNTYVYDALNRLTSFTSPVGATTLAYDVLSRRTSVTLPNGTQSTYTYDSASQVTNLLHKLVATSAQINIADYVYNPVGNRTSLTDKGGVQTFGYDSLDRLTSTTHPLTFDQSFSYDPVGNRTTNGNLYNAGNQLTEDANFTYQYDANGNLTRKTFKSTGNHIDYTYDAENRLVKVEEFAAGSSTPGAKSTYRYDGLGRRIEKVGNGITRRYVYDGEDILLEHDSANVLLARYTHGPGIDEPIAMTRSGANYFYHQDGLGTVTELTDSTGATARSYAYDAWGNILEQTGAVENPYTYTGREYDAETELYYFRARYYDPRSGRFLQKDPIGPTGRNINLYWYVRNNPVNLVDPMGLEPWYGNYCGPGNKAPQPPKNCIDRACQTHDECYNLCGITAQSRWIIPGLWNACAARCDTELIQNVAACRNPSGCATP
jgi:RHS repeat-associated protein